MMGGLSPEQGPPLWVPMRLFMAGAAALVLAGALLMGFGGEVFANRYMPSTLAFTHLITLGFFGAIMFGALYQMVPVVAGAPLPWPILSLASALLWGLGVLSLAGAFVSGLPALYAVASLALLSGLVCFVVPLAVALIGAPTRTATVWGLRSAAVGLIVVAGLGLMLTWVRAGEPAFYSLTEVWGLHVGFAALVWISGLISAVSWQVLPMFYTAPSPPQWLTLSSLIAGAVALVGGLASWALFESAPLNLAFLVPSALMTFVIAPVIWLYQISRRRRRRADASLRFWQSASVLSFSVAAAWIWAALSYDPRAHIVAGWLFFMGWGGLIVHGMLTRIVPFLVWFHRFSSLMGKQPVPPMRQLWPDRRIQRGWQLHGLTIIVGLIAILSGQPVAARVTGLLVLLLGGWILGCMQRALRTAA